ncbi:MAG: 6-phosphogluconolactonase [Solirubrobacteraceae bacterium]
MSVEIQVVGDPAAVCAQVLSEAAATGGHVVLTGGTSPQRAYTLAASQAPQSWQGAKLWFSDERCVPPDDERSNFGMVKRTLLDPLHAAGVEVGFCQRIKGEDGPQQAALEYQRELETLGTEVGAVSFELVLLGIGSDGHICSMFPNQASVSDSTRLVAGVERAGLAPFVPRVTLTFKALSAARRVLVLATGAGKADAVAAAFAQDAPHTPEVPASLLVEHVGEIVVLVDEDAASRL